MSKKAPFWVRWIWVRRRYLRCARLMSLAATGATGSYPARLWRLCVMAAALSLASAALAQGATAVRQLASPALAVKAGRQRGLSVLEKRRQEEQQEMAAAEAAAAKRKKVFRPMASVATVVVGRSVFAGGRGYQS